MTRTRLVLLVVCLLSAPLRAQDQTALVAQVKTDVLGRGVDLSGPCGAFAITERVAYRLRADGAGTLHKPTGNHCRERATDIIAYPTGTVVDILIDGGGTNEPAWHRLPEPADPSRWRPVLENPDGGAPPPPPPPGPTPAPSEPDLGAIKDALERLEAALLTHDRQQQALTPLITAHDERLRQHDEEPAWVRTHLRLLLEVISGAVGAWVLAR